MGGCMDTSLGSIRDFERSAKETMLCRQYKLL